MCRSPRVAMILPRIRAWLDRDEAIPAVVVGEAATGAGEVRVEWRRVLVILVEVAAGGVRLPDLHDRVPQRSSVAVEHAAGDDDPLADRLAGMLAGQVMIELGDGPRKQGRGEIVESLGEIDQRLGWRAQTRPDIVGVEVRRFALAHL